MKSKSYIFSKFIKRVTEILHPNKLIKKNLTNSVFRTAQQSIQHYYTVREQNDHNIVPFFHCFMYYSQKLQYNQICAQTFS